MVIVFILLLIDYFLCFDLPIYLDVNLRELEKQRSQLWRFFANWAIFGVKLATTILLKSPAKFAVLPEVALRRHFGALRLRSGAQKI